MRMRKNIVLGGVTVLSALLLFACGTPEKQVKKDDAPTSPAAVQGQAGSASGEAVSNRDAATLKDALLSDFTVGVSVPMGVFEDSEQMEFVQEQFNSITMENEMKPESLLDWEGSEASEDGMPVVRTENLDRILKGAKEYGIGLRGHCLVWHSQTPQWFFSKDYEPAKGYVDKETMKGRMESYIRQVLTYCQEKYPGVVYAWDVTNEVMGDDGWYRTESGWYETYGDESYIKDAFRFARKYAGSDVKLFLNDYNEYTPDKMELIYELLTELKKEGLVDGMGMQSHWDMEYPTLALFERALEKYGTVEGLEIQLTEVDMHNADDSEEGLKKQADRYKEFFEAIIKADRTGKANVTNVTFWGLSDDRSWLSGFKGETSYPLLFNEDLEKKPCYDSILEAAKEEYK